MSFLKRFDKPRVLRVQVSGCYNIVCLAKGVKGDEREFTCFRCGKVGVPNAYKDEKSGTNGWWVFIEVQEPEKINKGKER